jgi:hypothetical protein
MESGRARLLPLVYVASALTETAGNEVHRRVWSQNLVPLLLIATPHGVQIRSGFNALGSTQTITWAEIEKKKLPDGLSNMQALTLRGSVGWKDFSAKPNARVDRRMLEAIKNLSNVVRSRFPELSSKPELINTMIGHMLYLFVLIDRGVLDQEWVHRQIGCGKIHLSDNPLDAGDLAVWPADQVWALFDAVDRVLNGSVFPVSSGDRALFSAEAIHLIRRGLRSDAISSAGHQFGFLQIKLGSIRTETISAMYELFFALQDEELKAKHGAFYTPPYLADYILDVVDDNSPINEKSFICDPASGSGIFLVGAYRRIIEKLNPQRAKPTLAKLREILKNCIFGLEPHAQAANVARFSLYLTLLDYAPGVTLSSLEDSLQGEKLFPPLEQNVIERDFFKGKLPKVLAGRVTHIVGNPPWTEIEAGTEASEYREKLDSDAFPVDQNRLSELFVWRALNDALASNGSFGLLLSTKSFVSPSAVHFPFALAGNAKITGIANFWHFRNRLFANARKPAIAVFATKAPADLRDPVWVFSPLLTTQPVGVEGWPWAIVVDRAMVDHVRLADLSESDRAWFWYLMLTPLDRKYARVLTERTVEEHEGPRSVGNQGLQLGLESTTQKQNLFNSAAARGTSFGAFLTASHMFLGRGAAASQTGVAAKYILGTNPKARNYYRECLGLEVLSSRSYEFPQVELEKLQGTYRHLFGGGVLLFQRNLKHFDIIDFPVAFTTSLHAIAFMPHAHYRRVERTRLLQGLSRYLQSNLAQYLYALFGRLWLLDGRRFENNDLRDLPIPFSDANELIAHCAESLDEKSLADLFVRRFGLDNGFKDAVDEFAEFRSNYQDGQIPLGSFNPPSAAMKRAYVRAFERQLKARLGTYASVTIRAPTQKPGIPMLDLKVVVEGNDPKSLVQSALSFSNEDPVRGSRAEFTSAVQMEIDLRTSSANVRKPSIKAAWTVERAYADAQFLVSQVLYP